MKKQLFSLLLLWSCTVFTSTTFSSVPSACLDGVDRGNGFVIGDKGNGIDGVDKGNGYNSGEKGNGIA